MTHKITSYDMVQQHRADDGSFIIFMLKFSGFNKDWPKFITIEGQEYKFAGQEALPLWATSQYCGSAKYVKTDENQMISLAEQQEMLKDRTTIEEVKRLPYGLKFTGEQLSRKTFEFTLDTISSGVSAVKYLAFIDSIKDLQEENEVEAEDIRLEFNSGYCCVSHIAKETDEQYLARLNVLRRRMIEQHFQKLRSQKRVEDDKLARERKAYETFINLQKKFSSYTPEQIAQLGG